MAKGKNFLGTIEDVFKASEKVRSKSSIEIRGKVVSGIADKEFHFMDVSDSIAVKISDDRFLESAFIDPNRYIKIIDPKIEVTGEYKYLVLVQESQVIPTPKIKSLADANCTKLNGKPEEKTDIEKINKFDPDEVSVHTF